MAAKERLVTTADRGIAPMDDSAHLRHSWNPRPDADLTSVGIEDDSLRDGLQGAFTVRPPLAERIELLTLAAGVGVEAAMLGFPASGEAELRDCEALVRAVDDRRLGVVPRFLARAHVPDLQPIVALD